MPKAALGALHHQFGLSRLEVVRRGGEIGVAGELNLVGHGACACAPAQLQGVAVNVGGLGLRAGRGAAEALHVRVGAAALFRGAQPDAPMVVTGGQRLVKGEPGLAKIVALDEDAFEACVCGELEVVGGGLGIVCPGEADLVLGGEAVCGRHAREGGARGGRR